MPLLTMAITVVGWYIWYKLSAKTDHTHTHTVFLLLGKPRIVQYGSTHKGSPS